MNSLGEPECLDDLDCLRECPELRPALEAGDFSPDSRLRTGPEWTLHPVEDIGRFRFPGKREAYVYRLRRMTHADGREVWDAFGEYCWGGRSANDADYVFLDGGGVFSNRAAALWAIHLYLAHLHARVATRQSIPYGVSTQS